MSTFLEWLASWRKQQSRKRPVRPARPRLTLEYLEDRLVPAVIAVNTPLDVGANNTQITLRQAIELADGILLYGNLTAQQKQLVDLGLAKLKGLRNLTRLDLDGLQVTDKGLLELKGLRNLSHLSLNGTQMTDKGLLELRGLWRLESLHAKGTQVTDEGVDRLLREFPKVRMLKRTVYWGAREKPKIESRGER